jgi:hypothetical protein
LTGSIDRAGISAPGGTDSTGGDLCVGLARDRASCWSMRALPALQLAEVGMESSLRLLDRLILAAPARMVAAAFLLAWLVALADRQLARCRIARSRRQRSGSYDDPGRTAFAGPARDVAPEAEPFLVACVCQTPCHHQSQLRQYQ